MSDRKIVKPTITRKPASYRGQIRSQDYNDFQGLVVNDITKMASAINSIHSAYENKMRALISEITALKGDLKELQAKDKYDAAVAGLNSDYYSFYSDFRGAINVQWNSTIKSRAYVDHLFGEISLPIKNSQERFYNYQLANGVKIAPSSLDVQASGTFAKDGVTQDWEYGGLAIEGTVEKAFNGESDEFWIRKVEFPLNSNVSEVECEVIALIPRISSAYSNKLEIIPFPDSICDVTYIGISQDHTDAYTTISSGVDLCPPTSFHYSSMISNKLKIRLRQRHWVEENGKKVFYYGLRDVGMKIVDYDKSYQTGAPFGTNPTGVIKISPPTGYGFDRLVRIDLDPDCLDDTNKFIKLQLASTLGSSPNVLWDSSSDTLPQSLAAGVQLSSSTELYAIFELQYVDSGGSDSFNALTTPYVKGLGLTYSTVQV